MMYDRSSVMVGMRTDLHGATVASRASRARLEADKVQRSAVKVAANRPQPCMPSMLPIQRLAGRSWRPQAARGGSSSPPPAGRALAQPSNHLSKERICMHM